MMTTELSTEPFLAQGPVSLQLSRGHEASPAVRCADSSAALGWVLSCVWV